MTFILVTLNDIWYEITEQILFLLTLINPFPEPRIIGPGRLTRIEIKGDFPLRKVIWP